MKRYLMWLWLVTFLLLYAAEPVVIRSQPAEGGGGNQIMDSSADENPNNVEETLIDFTEFEERIQGSGFYAEKDELRSKNLADLTNEEVNQENLAPAYKIEAKDFNYDRWLVQLNSSADNIANRQLSYAKKIQIKAGKAYQGAQTQGGKQSRGIGNSVLGVRVHFPQHKYNANAIVRPPYELQSYNNEGSSISNKEVGKRIGVLSNVGKIKKISLDVSGRNYKNGIAIRLKNQFDEVREYFLGYAYFVNWRRLTWNNPNYINSIEHRDAFRVPLYPMEVPFVKFDSIVIYRPVEQVGGDFVVYFRKVDLWFDYAIPPEALSDLDIDDEQNWNIIKQKAMFRKNIQNLKAKERIEIRRSEILKAKGNLENQDVSQDNPQNQDNQQNQANPQQN